MGTYLWKRLFAGTLPANNFLFAGTLPENSFLFAGTVPANNFLFARTLPANNSLFAETLQQLKLSEDKYYVALFFFLFDLSIGSGIIVFRL